MVLVIDTASVTDDSGKGHLGGDMFQSFVIAIDEGRTFQEIEREIAAEAEFRKDGKFGAALFGLRRKAQDASRVSIKIAYCGIELSERYFHSAVRLG